MNNNQLWTNICRNTKRWWGTDETTATIKIINVAWSEGNTPQDWSKGLITPVYKKGEKLDPSNYRAITLLSIPVKVFCRMILNRIQVTIDNNLTEEQCGFRSSRGTTDAVFVVRQIIEKARERHHHKWFSCWQSWLFRLFRQQCSICWGWRKKAHKTCSLGIWQA